METNIINFILLCYCIVVVGAILSKSFNSFLLSQPVNVTVESDDHYEAFAIVNDSALGTIHGEFQLLHDDGTYLDIKMHLQTKELLRLGDCTQAALFAISFNDTLMTELRGIAESDVFSQELLIEVQFLYLGRKNEKSDVAYIHVSLDNFSKVTTPDVNNSTSVAESKSSTESAVLCTGNSMNISGSLPLFRAYSLKLIACFVLVLCCYY